MKMQALQPQVKALQDSYKGKPQDDMQARPTPGRHSWHIIWSHTLSMVSARTWCSLAACGTATGSLTLHYLCR